MTEWLFDTFVWTGCLIALVLVLRRPVARHFGPQVAYALWALPLLRLVMPPLVLPASFAPAQALPVPGAAPAEPLLVLASFSVEQAAAGIDWAAVLFSVWLGGTLAFLAWRAVQYRKMRVDLLAEARPVGEVGRIRLVETPAVSAPVAFGVRDKVVALPPLFMAQADRTARDLAIAHELAHHRGHDLVANIAAQPLLALHWFNPVAWWGWRAMRRDQEAACDARVVAGRAQADKATYAQVIAAFATGRHLALAAPMACPMAGSLLGEKSIIHRLRSLTMSDVSATRRKLGLAAIAGTAMVALPLTASISYAQADDIAAPEAPAAPAALQRVIRIERSAGGEDTADETEMAQVMADLRDMDIEIDGIDEEVASAMAEARAGMAEAEREMAEHRVEIARNRVAMAENLERMPRFEMRCDGDEQVQHRTDEQGREVVIICRRAVQASAAMGLREAQRAVRTAPGIPSDQREQILRDLQEQIDRMEGEEVSFMAAPPAPPAPMAPLAPVAAPWPVEFTIAPVVFTTSSVRVQFKATVQSRVSEVAAGVAVKRVNRRPTLPSLGAAIS